MRKPKPEPTEPRGGKAMKGGNCSKVEKDRVDQVKAKTKTWSDVVKGLKQDESKTPDSINEGDSDEPNRIHGGRVDEEAAEARRRRADGSRGANTAITRELRRAKVADNPTEKVKVRRTRRVMGRETRLDEEHKRGVRTRREEAGVTNQLELTRRDLKLSLRGSVERQAQHGPNWLKKPRIEGRELRA